MLDSPTVSFLDSSNASSLLPQTQSLAFLNSQLAAHGFISPSINGKDQNGLCLDGVSAADGDRVIKCLFGMIGQRVKDQEQAEQLSTKVRTLTYDTERLESMLRESNARADNMEREMEMFKARWTASNKSLSALTATHKQTNNELNRTRGLLQGIRATHIAELKRRERATEKVSSNTRSSSAKQGSIAFSSSSSTSSGSKLANALAISSTSSEGFWMPTHMQQMEDLTENALHQAEERARGLLSENLALKKVVVGVANELHGVVHELRTDIDEAVDQDDIVSLFPLAWAPGPSVASERLAGLVGTLRTRVEEQELASATRNLKSSTRSYPEEEPEPTVSNDDGDDKATLKAKLIALQAELDEARKNASNNIQSLLDTYESLPKEPEPLPAKRPQGSGTSNLKPPSSKLSSLEAPTAPLATTSKGSTLPKEPVVPDKPKEKKKSSKKRVSDAPEDQGPPERKRRAVAFESQPDAAAKSTTPAAGEEVSAVPAKSTRSSTSSKHKSSQVAGSSKRAAVAAPAAPRSPQRKVKFKTKELKTSSPRRKKHSHRASTSGSGHRNSLGLSGDKMVVYETEVDIVTAGAFSAASAAPAPASTAMDLDADESLGGYLPPASPAPAPPRVFSAPAPQKKVSSSVHRDVPMDVEPPPQAQDFGQKHSILPTEFVLPPPSPGTSVVLGLGIGPAKTTAVPPPQAPAVSQTNHNTAHPPAPQQSPTKPSTQPSHSSPLKPHAACAFPFSKKVVNIAHRHQYSPVRPSPLSRILQLGDSPETGRLAFSSGLERMDEEAEEMFPELGTTGVALPGTSNALSDAAATVVAPVAGPSRTSTRSTTRTKAKVPQPPAAAQAELLNRPATRSKKVASSSTAPAPSASEATAAAAPSSKHKLRPGSSKPSMGLPSRTRTRSPARTALGGVLMRSPGKTGAGKGRSGRSGTTGGGSSATAKGRVLFPS